MPAEPDTAEVAAADVPAAAAPLGAEAAALFEASAVPAILCNPADPEMRIVAANPAFLALTHHAGNEVLGRSPQLLLGARTERDAKAALATVVADGGTIEVLAARKDGATLWVECHAATAGRYRLVEVVDVTRRRDAEAALALSRQREALGLLTNSVAHEFNNFLQILIGYIDGLKRRLGDREEPFIQRAILRSTDAAERATILTRQLLAFSRRIAPDVRPVDLGAVVGDFVAVFRPTLPPRVTLAVECRPGLACAMSNPTQISFALAQILTNACEAMPKGGTITISTFAVAPHDHGMARPSDGAVGIAVADTGPGMAPEMAARALAPFATSREAGRGTGLAIVHGLMKRQGGTVSVESRPGEGTVVRLIFPATGVP
ncbi:ATP-binding protein [Methylobacterium sp. Leaf108]|uniref:ATP-binding protein n=1 Tax=Methylobacterium sp. Leaf108 TaxID=1736256 RepID=UPI0009E8578A|nr:ATP-binding protein [Methylobacterium sp. Leaf108]